jgi:L-type amino acid transporter 9
MIGSGIFISPVGVLKNAGSIGASLLIWVISGIIATCGSLSYAELGTMIPKSGGEYPYLKRGFGNIPAFIFAWTSSIVLKPSGVAIIAMVFGEYAIQPFFTDCDMVPRGAVKMAAAFCIMTVTVLNCVNVKLAEKVQIYCTIAKIGALIVITITGFYALAVGATDNIQNSFSGEVHWMTIGTSFYQGLWAYDGWNQLNYIVEELENPYVNLPRAIVFGIPFVTIIYVFVNIAYLAGLTMIETFNSPALAVSFGAKWLGPMSWIIPISVAISTFGGCNGYTMTGPRVCFAAARDGMAPRMISMIHCEKLTPVPAIMLNSLIAMLLIIPNNFNSLVNYFSFSMWLFHGGSALALLILRYREPNRERPYKVPIFVPVLVVIAALYLIFFPIISNPVLEYLYATIFILSGLLFYVPFVHYKYKAPGLDWFSEFVQKILVVVPSSGKEE